MIIECHHCKHIWNYKGNGQYATCPNCHYKVFIKWKKKKTSRENIQEKRNKKQGTQERQYMQEENERIEETQDTQEQEEEIKETRTETEITRYDIEINNLKAKIRKIEEEIEIIKYSVNTEKAREIKETTGLLLKCWKCGYEWEFKGLKSIARCPECNARNKVNARIIQEEKTNEKKKRRQEDERKGSSGELAVK